MANGLTENLKGTDMPNLSTSNVTDKTMMDFYSKALSAKRELEEAQDAVRSRNSIYRSVLKDAKKAGVDTTSITRVLADRKLDPDEIKAREQAYARMMAASGVMPNFQQELFGNLPTSDLTQENRDTMAQRREWDAGLFAGEAGTTGTLNPHPAGSDLHDQWHRGWLKGQEKNALALTPKKRPRAARKGKLDPAAEEQQQAT